MPPAASVMVSLMEPDPDAAPHAPPADATQVHVTLVRVPGGVAVTMAPVTVVPDRFCAVIV